MRTQVRMLVLGLATLAACGTACTRIATYVEHDPPDRFAGLRTYDWATPGPSAGTDVPDEPEFDARIREAVEEILAARGFERQGGEVDFLVAYSAAVDSDLRAVTIDRSYGYRRSSYLAKSGTSGDYPRSTAGRQTATVTYEQGSLVLSISTAGQPRRLLWRAYARSEIDPDATQAERDRRLREAVRLMLKDFPPR